MQFGSFALLILFTACTPEKPLTTKPTIEAAVTQPETKQLEEARVVGIIDVLLAGNVQQKLGLWSDPRFVAPWEWRKLSKVERDRLR